jgi:tRNA1Val (adenine37-N6)-methyltransferase
MYYSSRAMRETVASKAIDSLVGEAESLDALGTSGLKVIQAVKGYRHSMDAFVLAHFATPRPTDRVLDLGCGSGAIAFLLAHRHPYIRVVGFEIQPALGNRAVRGARLNGLQDRVEIVEGDLRRIETVFPPAGFDVVVCNPPYREVGRGRVSPDPETRQAKHELSATLPEVIGAIRYALRPKGRACLIYHASRLADLLAHLRAKGLEPKVVRPVHSFPGADAELVLVEVRREGRANLRLVPPLCIYQTRGGALSTAMEAIYRDLAASPARSGFA